MEKLSDRAIELLDELHTERLDYIAEYLPLMEAVQKLAEYENLETPVVVDNKTGDSDDKALLVKLIKVGSRCLREDYPELTKCMECRYLADSQCDITRLVDYLIENGVAIQQWNPVSKPPKPYEEVLLWDAIDNDSFFGYLTTEGDWEIHGYDSADFQIIAWMPKPKFTGIGENFTTGQAEGNRDPNES